jgi:hypothetical protein
MVVTTPRMKFSPSYMNAILSEKKTECDYKFVILTSVECQIEPLHCILLAVQIVSWPHRNAMTNL